MNDDAARVADLYERHAGAFTAARNTDGTMEARWLDAFIALLPENASVLDLGCGFGEPVATHLAAAGCRITGIDAAPSLIEACRARLPGHGWRVGDMRHLDLAGPFDGVIAWHSLFHLTPNDQRALFPKLSRLCAPGATLMFTAGPDAGDERTSPFEGEPLYHAALPAQEYRDLLTDGGFTILRHVDGDPDCGGATVWLARKYTSDARSTD